MVAVCIQIGCTAATDRDHQSWLCGFVGVWDALAEPGVEGMPVGEVPSEVWRRWREDPDFEPAGGESLATLDARVRAACDDLAERARDRLVAVVSHVSPIKSAVAWALGAGIEISWRTHLSHASICRIDVRSQGPVLITFNETPPPSK